MKVSIGKFPEHRWYHNWLFEKFGIKNEQRIKVHIDPWDTWSMDDTLSHLVLPMLKQLKDTTHGAPIVKGDDVPIELRATKEEIEVAEKTGEVDDNFFKRWDWIMGEMIFAFESKHEDWEKKFQSGEHDITWVERPKGLNEMVLGPNDTFKIDLEGHTAYQNRISNGFRLFGKYFENLWD